MDERLNGIKAAVATFFAALTAFWGWFGWLVIGWIAAMVLDYITGSCAALKDGTWSSEKARKGIWHKFGAVGVVLVTGLLDMVLGQLIGYVNLDLPFTYTVFLCPVVLVWYIITESGSIIENAGALGAPIPEWLKKAIAELKEKVDNNGNEDG